MPATPGSLSNAVELELLDHTFGNDTWSPAATFYLAASTADPTDDASGLSEPAGGGYSRVALTASDFDAAVAASRSIVNSGLISFPQATGSQGTLTHWAILDAASGGTMWAHGPLVDGAGDANPQTIGTDDVLQIAAGTLEIAFQSGGPSNYLVAKWLDHIVGNATFTAPGNIYLGADTADPGDDGSTTAEPLGTGAYDRKSTAAGDWDAAAAGALDNGNELSFVTASGANWGTITHGTAWDQALADHAVTGVNTGGAGTASFEVAGDQTGSLVVGALLRIVGSTGNDAVYTIRSGSSYNGSTTTTINVEQAVSDATADGTVWLLGRLLFGKALDASKDVNDGQTLRYPAGSCQVTLD